MTATCPRCGGRISARRGVDPMPYHLTVCPAPEPRPEGKKR